MSNFYIVTRNPIARAGIIRKLLKKGYRLTNGHTVSDYFTTWPAATHPVVIACGHDSDPNYSHIIDLNQINYINLGWKQVTNVKDIPDADCSDLKQSRPSPAFPEAAKYKVSYTKADGKVGDYTVSNPIEANSDNITCYAFGRGVRTFKKARVQSFSKI